MRDMSKFTLFTLILAVTAVTVMAELLANDYLQVNLSNNVLGQPGANEEIAQIFNAAQETETNELAAVTKPRTAPEVVDDSVEQQPSDVNTTLPTNPQFGIKDLREAGFFDPYISPVSAVEKVFGVMDVPERFQGKLVQAQIMEDNSSVGIVQEFHLQSSIDANELYQAIRTNGEEASYFDVNETNGYGEQSFYLNHVVNKDQVFIVIRRQNVVWALTYVKTLHPKFRILLERVI